ncbi:MAG: hypothetical protein BGO12_18015 [Verrucomicrobia bacterium 61-8]|nr:DUF4142 domain-containing protein [Verrucomicrobiota bacterium]OJV04229.1 MAG: hypothetical protein BGO12_18015 [Verrucomicrobia bacterium 61-8]
MKLLHILPAALLALTPALAPAASSAAPASCCGQMPSGAMTCPAFAQKVAMVDLLEIQLGKVAQTNASLPAVKKFGAYMTASHTEINARLAKVAAECGIPLPTQLDAPSQATLKKLAALKGPAFDKAYIPAMVAGHTQVLAMVKSFASTCPNPRMKAFAEKITPIIANHLKAAQKVQAQMQKDGLLP